MLSPQSDGATLDSPHTFTWDTGSGVSSYWLWVGSCRDCTDIYDASTGQRLSQSVRIPEDGRTIYVTLFSFMGGEWLWRDYQYRAPRGSTLITIVVDNKLAYSVNASANDSELGVVPAFSSRTYQTRVASLEFSWTLNQPKVGTRDLGESMAGRFSRVANPTGTYRYTVDNVVGDTTYFAPRITNATNQYFTFEANGGLNSQMRCNCGQGAYTENVHYGYYKLFNNSNVRMWVNSNYVGSYVFWGQNSDGRVSSGGRLPPLAETGSGLTRLRNTLVP
jgi:hypothetical protein